MHHGGGVVGRPTMLTYGRAVRGWPEDLTMPASSQQLLCNVPHPPPTPPSSRALGLWLCACRVVTSNCITDETRATLKAWIKSNDVLLPLLSLTVSTLLRGSSGGGAGETSSSSSWSGCGAQGREHVP